jgi:acetylornithine/LysW-gamma-L-lysine aminotransferase
VIESQDLPARAAEKGAYLLDQLSELDAPVVREVRGLGLMVGIELRTRVRGYLEALIGEGVLALPAGPTVLRLLPPLVIDDADLDQVLAALRRVLKVDPFSGDADDDD